jgi:AcrR family transcriptional regulator
MSERPRRAELLALGIQLFSEHAFDELSMDEIAARAGVAKGLLYYYFGSKRGFYVAAVRAAAEELRAQWQTDDPFAGVEAYLRHARERAEGYRTLMAGGVGSDPEVRAILDEERRLVIERVVAVLGLPAAPPALRTALEGWLSYMEGATLDWVEHRDLPLTQVRDIIVAMLAGSLAAAHQVDRSIPAGLPTHLIPG